MFIVVMFDQFKFWVNLLLIIYLVLLQKFFVLIITRLLCGTLSVPWVSIHLPWTFPDSVVLQRGTEMDLTGMS